MRFDPPLIPGRLVRRYKRFLADVEIDGQTVVVHCANPGRMTTCAEVGGRVWLFDSQNDKRKLRLTWELAEIGDDLVCVNTARANQLVAAALEASSIAELSGYADVHREVAVGDSRIDFALEGPSKLRCLVEVKTVTLRSGTGECSFPDSVTKRGLRHLEELASARKAGDRTVLLFVCGRTRTSSIRPAWEIDERYAEALAAVQAAGVELIAYSTRIDVESIEIEQPIPVRIEPWQPSAR